MWVWLCVWVCCGYGSAASTTSTPTLQYRTHPGPQDPGMDAGPVVVLRVSQGDTAWLPCPYPRPQNDAASLVLWYRNHTSRPFLSYDGRAEAEHNNQIVWPKTNDDSRRERVRLELLGTALVVEGVGPGDAAEYRCRVHYRLSPTWTRRIRLVVLERVSGVWVVDGAGNNISPGATLGPFASQHIFNLTCTAKQDKAGFKSLLWLRNGEEVSKKWTIGEDNNKQQQQQEVVINRLQTVLEPRHHLASFTCCLNKKTGKPEQQEQAVDVTQFSATITMFHVPEAMILVTGPRVWRGDTGYLATEGTDITFLCSVNALPPAYNVTWLFNGRVVAEGGRRWRKSDRQLQVSPVRREDAGLYNCLASNSEGDGHSNALLLRIAYPPECQNSGPQEVVAPRNTSLTLSCKMDALPENLTFTWRLAAPPAPQHTSSSRGGVITGDAPTPHHPGLIDLTPGKPEDGIKNGGQDIMDGGILGHKERPSNPLVSHLVLTPTAPTRVFCYAKNSVGRTTLPCSYLLRLVEPPDPPRLCNVTVVGATQLHVKCEAAPPQDSGRDHHASPGISFVRSSGVMPRTNVEIWSAETLVANVSSPRPELSVSDLPPNTQLRVLLYSITPHARSQPLRLQARTPPHTSLFPTAITTLSPPLTDTHRHHKGDKVTWSSMMGGSLGSLLGGLLVGIGLVVVLVTVMVILVVRRRKRQQGQSGRRGKSTSHHNLDISHSSLNIEPHGSVYCVSTGDEGGDPWQETSVTHLVALSSPLTPPPLSQSLSVSSELHDTGPSDII